ncbi:MAG: UDP-N-acetylmuramate--L-alanine ligase [Rikenellaceae bacterium]|nr:UDP-N-acetylmuramate--L-alanine ligase [Rikenellaceae bacterium]
MEIANVYFLGIGGIGMSAIARWFLHQGKRVGGYDRTPTALTAALEREGARIHYEDRVELIGSEFRNPADTLVIYTPAIPADHSEWRWFVAQGFEIVKRSQALGHLCRGKFVMAVAGTHGKTTTSTLAAWLNRCCTAEGGSAFLGGISKNFDSNLVLGGGRRMVVEADEFDRSFLRLDPDVAVITSADADHLDIYGTHEAVKEAFAQFAERIRPGGTLIIKQGVDVAMRNGQISVYRYSYDAGGDFYARNAELLEGGYYRYDIVCPDRVITGCRLGIPGWVNIENSVAAVAMLWAADRGFDEEKLREGLASFSGVRRRFDFYINTPQRVYMDDYAHHPRELSATITSVKRMFPGREVTAVFQPHLYTRTRDLYAGFAEALSEADRVVLIPIYPARELPIEGVSSQMIAERVSVPCTMSDREHLADTLAGMNPDVVITFGAGNIDACCAAVAEKLKPMCSKRADE